MKQLSSTLLCLLLISQAFSQSLNDSVFNNVIKITDKDVGYAGESYLVDIPILPATRIALFYNESKIPNYLFLKSVTFYPQLKEFFLISQDWNYYARVASLKFGFNGGCAKPVQSTIIYKVKRDRNILTIDSIQVQNNKAVINFNEGKIHVKGYVVSYLEESYRSKCCPGDLTRDVKPTHLEFIKYYEQERKIKIFGIYQHDLGVKHGFLLYYSFVNLPLNEKLNFILARLYSLIPDKHLIKLAPQRDVLTPTLIKKGGLKLIG